MTSKVSAGEEWEVTKSESAVHLIKHVADHVQLGSPNAQAKGVLCGACLNLGLVVRESALASVTDVTWVLSAVENYLT